MKHILIEKKIITFLLLFGFFCTSCATRPAQISHFTPIRPDYLVEEYTPDFIWTAVTKTHDANGSEQIQLQISNQDPIIMNFFRSENNSPTPALLISPILGGKNRVANHFASYFSRRGYHCLVVHRPKDLDDDKNDPFELDQSLKSAVLRDQVALNWLIQQEGVDADRLGSFGISYGGIKNTVLAGVDKRLKANVIALAGADMASIIMNSNLKSLRKSRQKVMETQGWNRELLEFKIRDTLRTEPLRFAPYINPNTTMLILARMDATVPRENGELLREALRYPKTLYLPTGHYSGALLSNMLLFPFIETKTLEFLDQHLKD